MTKGNIVLVILVIGISQVLLLGRVILKQNKIFWPSEKTSEFLLGEYGYHNHTALY